MTISHNSSYTKFGIRYAPIAFLFLLFQTNTVFGQLTSQDVLDETLTIREEFSVESDDVLYPDQTYTPLATYKGATYLVYVNRDRYPMLAKYENGNLTTVRLDNNDAYKVKDNGHHKFSLGIDTDGYIHIAGDMHNYPYSNAGHLPSSYQGGRCMYWVSDNPEDISSFSFEAHSDRAPQGVGHTYIYFVNDNNGVLYFGSRSQNIGEGPQGANVERYDTRTKRWTQLGGDFHNSGKKLMAWSNNARAYQGMRSDVRFDKNNRMHFTVIVRNGSSNNPVGGGAKSASGVIYAYSDDGGNTFHKADGSRISSLPMWSFAGSHQADIITSEETWISMPASVAFNQYDEPFVHYTHTNNGTDIAKYRQWSNASNSWGPIRNLPLNANGWDRQWNDGRGVITLSSFFSDEMYRTADLTGPGVHYDMSFTCVDRRYLKESGELRGLSREDINGGYEMKVVTLMTDLDGNTTCPQAGTPCNDGNSNTQSDVEDGNCNCAGTAIQVGTATVSLTSPVTYQVFQRNDAGRADIQITGRYQGNAEGGIEAQWNQSSVWTQMTVHNNGTFSGTLPNMRQGQGTLRVRSSNNPSTTVSVPYVGVGDIFIITGQSNASGRGRSINEYSHATIKAGLFGNDDEWKELVDPIDDEENSVDNVSNDPGAGGTPFMLSTTDIMDEQNIPIAWVPCAKGGSRMSSWLPNSNHGDASTLYGSMYRRINEIGGKAKGIVYYQGEGDVIDQATQAEYESELNEFVNAVASDFPGLKVMVGQVGPTRPGTTNPSTDEVRAAQQAVIEDNGNALRGPITYDIDLSDFDGLHYREDADVVEFARRWSYAIDKEFYGGRYGFGPIVQSSNVTYNDDENIVFVPFTSETSPALSSSSSVSPSSFELINNGQTIQINTVRIVGNTIEIVPATSLNISRSISLTYGTIDEGINNAIYDNNLLPAQTFYNVDVDVSTDNSGGGNTTTAQITRIEMYNARTDAFIRTLRNNETIDLGVVGTELNFVAVVDQTVGSIQFGYDNDDNYHIENGAPYAFASNSGADYFSFTPTVGSHTLSARAYDSSNASGQLLDQVTLNFTVIESCSLVGQACNDGNPNTTNDVYNSDCNCVGTTVAPTAQITRIELHNARTDAFIRTLRNNETIDLGVVGTELNFIAIVDQTVGSIQFGYDNDSNYHIENVVPYAFSGDNGSFTPTVGTHILSARAYESSNASGQLLDQESITFTVIESCTLTGQACNDRDACTTNDRYDADCNCVGVFQDEDNDGICDAEDDCDGSLVGRVCNDNDVCTTNDRYDANCNCVGTYRDADNDGVCAAEDANDNDPCIPNESEAGCSGISDDCSLFNEAGFENSVMGIWNDGGASARLLSSSNFSASGTSSFYVQGNDGVQSSLYSDPIDLRTAESIVFEFSVLPYLIEGDDSFVFEISTGGSYIEVAKYQNNIGLENQTRKTISTRVSDINFSSTTSLRLRSTTDDVADYFIFDDLRIEVCNGSSSACNVGSACDDGDSCTIGETYDASCNCTGGTVRDTDNDGVCDTEDACPNFDNALIGQPCDDNNNCTIGEVYTSNCDCGGGVYVDNDNDGYCIGEDQNDNDPCIPVSASNCEEGSLDSDCEVVSTTTFEGNDMGVWIDGGLSARLLNSASFANTGTGSFYIQDDKGTASSLYTSPQDYSGYKAVEVEFSYLAYAVEAGDSFVLEVDNNGSDNFQVIETFEFGQDFQNQDRNTGFATIGNMSFGEAVTIRLRSITDSASDYFIFDDIIISGCKENNSTCAVGAPCDDGDSCTTGETYDANCNCTGGSSDCEETCIDFDTENFESSIGIWNDGGTDSDRIMSAGNAADNSDWYIRLRDNSGVASTVFTDELDLSGANSAQIDFVYYPNSMEASEDFMLELSLDNGATWNAISRWVSGTDFTNNRFYNESVQIEGPFSAETRFRFRCDASSNADQVYIDNIKIDVCGDNLLAPTSTTSQKRAPNAIAENISSQKISSRQDSDDIDLDRKVSTESELQVRSKNELAGSELLAFPNPANDFVNLDLKFYKDSETTVLLYDRLGILHKTINLSKGHTDLLRIDVSSLKPDCYIVMVKSQDTPYVVTKLLIHR